MLQLNIGRFTDFFLKHTWEHTVLFNPEFMK